MTPFSEPKQEMASLPSISSVTSKLLRKWYNCSIKGFGLCVRREETQERNGGGDASFRVLLDPHLGNGEGEADAALRLVRLHGVAGGEQEGQRLPDGGVENHQRRGKFQRHGGGIPAFVGRLLHEADVGD